MWAFVMPDPDRVSCGYSVRWYEILAFARMTGVWAFVMPDPDRVSCGCSVRWYEILAFARMTVMSVQKGGGDKHS